MILDSTFLIDVLRGSSDVSELIEELDASGTPLVSALTVMELYEGVQLAETSDAERAAVEALLDDIDSVPFDSECAIRAGQLLVELSRVGEPIDETDVMIAATALVHERPVVTRNVKHFERVPGLDVVSY